MTTTLHRYSITETAEVAHGIAIAATTWPELQNDRGALLRKLIALGIETAEDRRARKIDERRAAIRKYAGSAKGVYPPNAAELLKSEWPE